MNCLIFGASFFPPTLSLSLCVCVSHASTIHFLPPNCRLVFLFLFYKKCDTSYFFAIHGTNKGQQQKKFSFCRIIIIQIKSCTRKFWIPTITCSLSFSFSLSFAFFIVLCLFLSLSLFFHYSSSSSTDPDSFVHD